MPKEHFRVEGSLALVTGAGSGIGRATAIALAGRGARTLCVDIDEAGAKDTAELCGPTSAAYPVDVADAEAMVDLAGAVTSEHGAVELLINNAGVGMSGPFLDTALGDWDWILGVNLRGVINGCHAFGPAMVDRGRGHVVNLSSALGYTPTAREPAYVTTKAAVLALSRCLRADWSSHGVGVSAICPGVINTSIIAHTRFRGKGSDPESVAKVEKMFRRGHKPEAVARAIISAAERNRAVVPVGFEARLGWALNRLAPLSLTDRLARAGGSAR